MGFGVHVLDAVEQHTHTVILLHGRGSNGEEFVEDLQGMTTSSGQSLFAHFPGVRWVFPSAQTLWSSQFLEAMSAWFDAPSLTDISKNKHLQVPGLKSSVEFVRGVIQDEVARLGGDAAKVVLGGISQGQATALHVLLGGSHKLGGFVGASGWLPFADEVEELGSLAEIQGGGVEETPVFLGHGTDDEMVDVKFGRQARDVLKAAMVKNLTWKEYVGAELDGHWFKEPEEMDDIVAFLRDCFVDSLGSDLKQSSMEWAWLWPGGNAGPAWIGTMIDALLPQAMDRILDMACGGAHAAAILDGRVATWGRGLIGHEGDSEKDAAAVVVLPSVVEFSGGHRVCEVAAGWNHTAFVTGEGDGRVVKAFGLAKRGQLGSLSSEELNKVASPLAIPSLDSYTVSIVAANGDHSAALSGNLFHLLAGSGQLYLWGKAFDDQSGAYVPFLGSEELKFHQVSLGWNHGLGLTEYKGWKNTVVSISAGSEHSAAVDAAGDLYAWGWGEHGQLGLGHFSNERYPCRVVKYGQCQRSRDIVITSV
ncbi:hypothetical protein SELMODRAFT_419214 [Selaginella moellendorffii]|uniref:Phospholipase/carboxylesterase/thioesterase domain-containing protein n=1 Tax=Selaginella moellendorffii TaxID=88036 RepID=D8S877_SELML|nr:hypothetical protein SELMODRAFT_419214 [Selaginella moellendorffii]